jgi:hypoxanthine phosphoribosyltransferase
MIKIKDKDFVPFINKQDIEDRIQLLGKELAQAHDGENPILLGILNGSFMFLSDLAKNIPIPAEFSFVKFSSYEGESSTGNIKELLGLEKELTGRTVIIVEDIIDTGLTMTKLLEKLQLLHPKKVFVCTLLLKPEALLHDIRVDYVGFKIPNKFVVGYGLDYDGFGRNLPEIYQLK